MLVSDLADKKILIAGLGREGRDSFLFLRKLFPKKSLGVADKKEFGELEPNAQRIFKEDRNVVLYFGDSYLSQLNAYDVVVKAPGIPSAVFRRALKPGKMLTSQTNLFLANCPGVVVGVTGTKGKSTTASMIELVLRAGGVKARLVGNIGEPALKFLEMARKDDVFVYELSSAQLELAWQSPHVAVLLNVYPEHLDHHGTFEAYAQAKANITKFQTADDYLIFNEADGEVRRIAEASKAKKLPYAPKPPKGAPYVAALEPVFLVAKVFGVPKEKAQKALKNFKPLPHRLEFVGTHQGITFYNDSLATVPEAVIAALDALGGRVATLIAGGYNRGVDLSKLAEYLSESKAQNVVLLPETGELLWKELERRHKKTGGSLPNRFAARDMAEAVELCFRHTPKGRVCLLSPGAASFNQFRDYRERGEEFMRQVKRYGKAARS